MSRSLDVFAASLVVIGSLTIGVALSSEAAGQCIVQCYDGIECECACEDEAGCGIKYTPGTARNIWSVGFFGFGDTRPLDCIEDAMTIELDCECHTGCNNVPEGLTQQGGNCAECDEPVTADWCQCKRKT